MIARQFGPDHLLTTSEPQADSARSAPSCQGLFPYANVDVYKLFITEK